MGVSSFVEADIRESRISHRLESQDKKRAALDSEEPLMNRHDRGT
jgi:hypothetical protein